MLKPIDLMVLCWLVSRGPAAVATTQAQLATGLGIAQSAVSRSLGQLRRSGLVEDGEPRRTAAEELMVHGVRYVYPARLGPPTRGLPTAYSGPVLASLLVADSVLVWPTEASEAFGPSLEPIHPAVPAAALRDAPFYEIMSLLDALRVGRARERKLAQSELRARLHR